MLDNYLPVLIFVVVGIAFGVLPIALGYVLAPNKPDSAKLSPYECGFEAFEDSLTAEKVKAIINDLEERQVSLSMPKFEFESSFILKEALAGMGMSDAFSANADFSGMAGNRDLVISDIVHKAFVSVDESGTEAAAAVAVVVGLTSVSPEASVEITIDHPFMFLIRDIETGAILFVGRVMNPNG
jgi:serpin B